LACFGELNYLGISLMTSFFDFFNIDFMGGGGMEGFYLLILFGLELFIVEGNLLVLFLLTDYFDK
jgi:hypothetical protein